MGDYAQYKNDASLMVDVQPPDGFPEGMDPGQLNNSARESQAADRRQHERAEWIDFGDTVTRTSATSFNVVGLDATSRYTVGRRLRFEDASLLYGTVVTSSYVAPDTQVTVAMDAGSLTIALTAVSYGINNPIDSSLGTAAFTTPGQGVGNVGTSLQLDFDSLNAVNNPDTQNGHIAMRVGTAHQEVPWSSVSDGMAGSAEFLRVDPTTSPTQEIRVQANRMTLRSTSGASYVVSNVNAVANINTIGVGGRAEATLTDNAWQYVYVVSNRATTGVLLSTSSSYGYVVPAGYDYAALVSAVYVESGAVIQQEQRGLHTIYLNNRRVFTGTDIAPNIWVPVDLSDFVPTTASSVDVTFSCNTSPVMAVSGQSDGRNGAFFTGAPGGVGSNFGDAIFPSHAHRASAEVRIASPQVYVFFGGSSSSMHVRGFRLYT